MMMLYGRVDRCGKWKIGDLRREREGEKDRVCNFSVRRMSWSILITTYHKMNECLFYFWASKLPTSFTGRSGQ